MMVGGSRLRQIGWAMTLGLVFVLFAALSFRVSAVKSDVIRAEREIIALTQENMRLETEFETRANQQQLANWNAVDFGYTAPRADQYLENERQLASLSQPVLPGAPSPIRVARAEIADDSVFPAMVSPLTGKQSDNRLVDPDGAAGEPRKLPVNAAGAEATRPSLAERLGMAAELEPRAADFAAARIGE